ncbi:hypothetical protein V6N13_061887 [Hibiscus sabdariffa]
MVDFGVFIADLGYVDLLASGKVLTWFGDRRKGSRLDRFLVSVEGLDKYGSLEQHNLPRTVSYHSPVCLSNDVVDWGSKPFRFLNA